MKSALLVIDLQNDYFPGGHFPLWNATGTLQSVLTAMARAKSAGAEIILIQHVAAAGKAPAPFFNAGTPGVAIHPDVLAAAPGAPVVIKQHADSFHQTELATVLAAKGIGEIVLCGMMTQNCVTHTALAKAAESYRVAVVADACTTVSEILHLIALKALSIRVPFVKATEAFGA